MDPRLISKGIIECVAHECYDPEHDADVLSPAFRETILNRKCLAKGELLKIVRWKTGRRSQGRAHRIHREVEAGQALGHPYA